MNKQIVCFVAVMAVLVSMGQAQAQAPALGNLDVVERSVPDGPVAMVDNVPIPREEFLLRYFNECQSEAMMSGNSNLDEPTRVRAALRALMYLLQREILHQEGLAKPISVPEADVNAVYQKKLDLRLKALAERGQENPTEADVLELAGQSKEDALKNVRRTVIADRMAKTVLAEADLTVPETDVQKFYEMRKDNFRRPAGIHLKQIFVRSSVEQDQSAEAGLEAARKKTQKALARIRAGESFEAVAKEVSEAPDAANGGDMGMLPQEMLPLFLSKAVEKMQPEDLSDLIESDYGLHIVQLVNREEESYVTLEEAGPRIKAALEGMKAEAALARYCEPIAKDNERVKIFLDLPSHVSQGVAQE